MSETRRLAAIDIGTVTTRLLVADVGVGSVTEVARSTDITHLGRDLARTGVLAPEGMERVARVIDGYVATIELSGVEHVSAVATSASRDAGNADEFRAMLTRRGVEPRIIEGAVEAELSFAGATALHDGEGLLVVDCGGGSTELVFGNVSREGDVSEHDIVLARSIDVGSRRLTDLHLPGDPPSEEQLQAAREWAASLIQPYFERLTVKPQEMIAVAGTATSLAAVHLGLETYDSAAVHGFELTGSDLADLLEMFVSLTLEQRREVVGLHPGRADVIIGGTLILETVLALSGLEHMVVSEHDILYGILLDAYRELRESSS